MKLQATIEISSVYWYQQCGTIRQLVPQASLHRFHSSFWHLNTCRNQLNTFSLLQQHFLHERVQLQKIIKVVRSWRNIVYNYSEFTSWALVQTHLQETLRNRIWKPVNKKTKVLQRNQWRIAAPNTQFAEHVIFITE